MKYAGLFVSALRRRGPLMALRLAWHEVWFDLRYGTETREYVEAEAIDTDSQHKQDGHKYGPLQIPFFRQVFGEAGPVRDRKCFVDFGCGKGRPLILAALHGFRRIIGVEYSASLCARCRANIEGFRARTGCLADIEVVHADVVAYEVPDDASTLVFYDPFGMSVFEKVLANVDASFKRAPRELYVVFFNGGPRHRQALADGGFHVVREYPNEATLVCRRAP